MNKLCTLIVIQESFLLFFISKIVARLEEAEAPCFMKNASAYGSSKSQMLQSLLPLPALKRQLSHHPNLEGFCLKFWFV